MARLEEQKISGSGEGRTMFVPPMEPFGARLIAAVFRSIGYNAEVLAESDETLALGMKYTGGGECVPCPTTTGALIKAMRDRKLPPEKVIFFMPTACGPCRFGQYAKLDSIIFEKLGWGDIRIMSPSAENAYSGIDNSARMRMWHAIVVSDVMRKLVMKIRPYEKNRGEADYAIEELVRKMEASFETGRIAPISETLSQAVDQMGKIATVPTRKPLIGIVGEIYVRSDPFINGDLIRRIEKLGGEAMLAPVSEWILYTNHLTNLIVREQQHGLMATLKKVRSWLETNFFFEKWEHHYYEIAEPLLHDRREYPIDRVMEIGGKYLPWQFEGEALLTLGRAALFVTHDKADAIVNASPMFCMPGTITSSIFPKFEEEYGVPVVCNFYDGSGDPNQSLVPVMHYLREEIAAAV
jgi:predicted nucleotide-binding protein (sugar kinase/HSP70/actin superfamily)